MNTYTAHSHCWRPVQE